MLLGRLAEYKYYNIDAMVLKALELTDKIKRLKRCNMKLCQSQSPVIIRRIYVETVSNPCFGGDEVEIIIVDDGSTKDRTAEIADEYAAKYPGIVKAVHQENVRTWPGGQHRSETCNRPLFQVVDSDDWLDKENYPKVLDKLAELVREGRNVDMMLCNYIYDKQGAKHKKAIRYANVFPQDQVFTWRDAKHLSSGTVYSDALRHLPHTDVEKLWTGAAQAYLLCG